MGFKCFKCLKTIEGDLKLFMFHLRHSHSVQEWSRTKMICSQNGCKTIFLRLSSFKRHIITQHEGLNVGIENEFGHQNQEGNVENRDQVVQNMDDNDGGLTVGIEHEFEHHNQERNLENRNQFVQNMEDNDCDNDELVDEEVEPTETFSDVHEMVAVFVAKLKANTAVPGTFVNEIVRDVSEIFSHAVNYIKHKVSKLTKQVHCDGEAVAKNIQKQLYSDMDELANLFEEFQSDFRRNDYFLKKGALLLPEEKLLGHTLSPGIDPKTGNVIQIEQSDTFQYVPIETLLKKYLQKPGMMKALLDISEHHDRDLLNTYRNGSYFKDFWNDQNKKPLIPLLLYSDDFETANPLGSKRGVHKIFAVYISVLSVPPTLQSRLEHIHLVALARSKVVSKYGFHSIFRSIVEDLNKAISDGIYVTSKDFQGLVYPKLFQVVGDNLAINPLLGFSSSFSANYFCRFCKLHKTQTNAALEEVCNCLRNKENIDEDVILSNPPQTGVWRSSIFNDISYFHAADNLSVDIMHDIFEGVAPKEMKLVLRSLIQQGCFKLDELNQRILCFSYGFKDKRNRPSPILESALKNPGGATGQKAAQMVCLVTYLPLIIGDKIPLNSDVWEIMLLLFDIIKIISSTSVSIEGTNFLQTLVKEHHRLYLLHFPAEPLTPKQHFMVHYPRIIRQLGPLCQYSTMRFEGMHKPMKNYARLCNNFQNIAKTLARKYQSSQSYKYLLQNSIDQHHFNLFDQSVVEVKSVEAADEIIRELSVSDQYVTICNRIEVCGYEFRRGSMITSLPDDNIEDSEPQFSEIINVLVIENEVYFVGKDWQTLGYERHLNAFAVKPLLLPKYRIRKPSQLSEHMPLHATQSHETGCEFYYIAVRSRCV